MIQLFDAHCHLQDKRLLPDIDRVVARAAERGVSYMVCCGSCEEDWKSVYDLSSLFPSVLPSCGLHPWYIAGRTGQWLDRLKQMLLEVPSAGVGEIGLDYAIEICDKQDQRLVFRDQLRLARTLKRPVTIHCRKAWGDLVDVLRNEITFPSGGIVHSWSGAPDLVAPIEKLGLSISFSGSVTRDRNKRARESARVVSPSQLLIETDSPDILPAGVNSTNNEPSNITLIAETLAVLRGTTFEKIAALTFGNAQRLFCRGSA